MLDKFSQGILANKYILGFCLVSGLAFLVIFRMKALDQDYAYTELNNKIRVATTENKQVKAMRAKMLSSESLQKLAQKHSMKAPNQNQLIIIK